MQWLMPEEAQDGAGAIAGTGEDGADGNDAIAGAAEFTK
jgi:hypothetical protein